LFGSSVRPTGSLLGPLEGSIDGNCEVRTLGDLLGTSVDAIGCFVDTLTGTGDELGSVPTGEVLGS
jgi:hypothetical protein